MTKILFTIDGGNTNLSVGIHSEHEELKVLSYNEFLKNLKEYAPLLNHSPAIYCSVRDYPEIDENIFPKLIKVPNFKGTMYLGMPINYSETIGKDRLVGSLYCFDKILNRKKNKIAFIDAGTFITVDFISHKGLEGGFIFPGLELLSKSYLSGEQLSAPNIIPQLEAPKLATSTKDAIHSAYSILIQSIVKTTENRSIVLTGGNSEDLRPLFEEVQVEKNLMHNALRWVLNCERKSR